MVKPLVVAVLTSLGLLGCAQVPVEKSGKPDLPEKQPDWVQPSRILLASQLPEDSDQDTFIDTIPVTVYLFDERFPLPISVEGAFMFRVSVPGGKKLAEWNMDAAQTTAAIRKMRPGPGYLFRLNLAEGGGVVRETTSAELTVIFRPASGTAEIKSQGATAFRLGKSGA
jgi:hypothetical protein